MALPVSPTTLLALVDWYRVKLVPARYCLLWDDHFESAGHQVAQSAQYIDDDDALYVAHLRCCRAPRIYSGCLHD